MRANHGAGKKGGGGRRRRANPWKRERKAGRTRNTIQWLDKDLKNNNNTSIYPHFRIPPGKQQHLTPADQHEHDQLVAYINLHITTLHAMHWRCGQRQPLLVRRYSRGLCCCMLTPEATVPLPLLEFGQFIQKTMPKYLHAVSLCACYPKGCLFSAQSCLGPPPGGEPEEEDE